MVLPTYNGTANIPYDSPKKSKYPEFCVIFSVHSKYCFSLYVYVCLRYLNTPHAAWVWYVPAYLAFIKNTRSLNNIIYFQGSKFLS
jgi:hypothetical protein